MADILDASKSNTQPPSGTIPPPDANVPPAPPVSEPVPVEPVEPAPPPAGGLPATGSDSLIIPPPEAPAPPPPEEPKQEEMKPPEKPKKKSRMGVLLAGLLFLVITLPILVVFVRQQIEIRSRATSGVYPPTCIFDNNGPPICVGSQLCDNPIGEMGWITTDHNCPSPYFFANGTCITNGNCLSPTNCREDASCGGGTITPTPVGSQMFYCKTDTHSCVGTTDLYTDVNTCVTNVNLYGQTPNTGACWASGADCQSACQSGSQMFYCKTDTHSCVGTTDLYTDVNTCVTNVNLYGQTPNSGACYASSSECSTNCSPITPTITFTPTRTPTRTPTLPPGQCINIVVYKDGNALSASELAALQPGDTITLAFAPGGAATKVRFRVNSGSWNETTTKNANAQFIWNYTLTNTTSFTIEAQWFDGSVWH